MHRYGREVEYPILSAYTQTAGSTAGPRVVRLWRVPGADNYVRLANADHEAWPVNTSTAVDNGVSEPYRFVIAGVNTAPADFPKSWYFPPGSYYKTSYNVSWWDRNYGSSSRRGFIRFRPIVVAEHIEMEFGDIPSTGVARTRGFGLVQYFGRKVGEEGVPQPLYGVGIVVMASVPSGTTDPQSVTFRKYLAFFIGDRCVWHYEFANPTQVAHAIKTDGVWQPTIGANWISMRAGPNANDVANPINIGVFVYRSDDDITESPMTGLLGALSGAASVNMPDTKIDLYTEHMVARVHIDLEGENQTPSGGATGADRTGTGNRQWFVPSITTGDDSPGSTGEWLGWNYWQFHTWLLGVQSPFREFTMSIPLNVVNPPSGSYQVRVRSFHQVDRPLSAPSYFVAFRGTDNPSHYPNAPQNATVYTPVSAPHPYDCCGWYRPWDNANSREPQHRYWWVDHKIVHGVL